MRYGFLAALLLLGAAPAMSAQVSIGISIGVFPELTPIPGYPVYYAPRMDSNYFFYDGSYWVFQDDNWYTGAWYNGPWDLVNPVYVPFYLLQVPVRYYRRPPAYFRGWQANAQPRWADHWGNGWARQRSGWDRPNRAAPPVAAPLPTYQRQFSGSRYPPAAQQRTLRDRNYRYQQRERVNVGGAPANQPPRANPDRQSRDPRDQDEKKPRQDEKKPREERRSEDRRGQNP